MGSAPPSPLHAVEALLRSGRLDSPGRQDHPAADILIETTDVGFVSFSALTTRVKPDSAVSPPHACPNCCRTAPRERAAATPFVHNAADLVLAPVPTVVGQSTGPSPVRWIMGSPAWEIRQLCAAQFEFSMEDADRMTPSQAFVSDPPVDASVTAAYEDDLASDSYINNSTRVWCWRPDVLASFQTLRAGLRDSSDLSGREVAAMVAATAAARGDPYCSLAWGARLAELSDEATAARVLQGDPSGLSSREAALARWSRQVVLDSNAPTQADVDHLRDVGCSDREIFEATGSLRFVWRSRPSTTHSAHRQTRN
jgi:uncharacterized protein YciW